MTNNIDSDNKSFFSLALETITSVSKTISIFITFLTFVYIMGWFQASAYFSKFHASWLISQLDTFTLLRFSWIPLILIIFFIWLGIDDLTATKDQKTKKRQKFSFKIASNGWWIILIYLIVISVMDKYISENYMISILYLLISLLLLYAVAAFECILIFLKNKSFKWDSADMSLVYIFIFVTLYFLPTKYGEIQGLKDSNIKKSDLPIVKLKNDKIDYRLILANNDKLFVTVFGDTSIPTLYVKIFNITDVEYIHDINR